MKTANTIKLALAAVVALAACAVALLAKPGARGAGRLVLSNVALRAEIAPAPGGRLMAFGRADGGPNALWTAPPGLPPLGGWVNHGGEKTWVGDMPLWKGLSANGCGWPPPAWFDQDAQAVVSASPTGAVLRTGVHEGDGWAVALERAFRLDGDRLVVREALLCGKAPAEAGAADPYRVWSVTQVPFSPHLAARLRGDGDARPQSGFPEPAARHGEWVEFDISAVQNAAMLRCDADALAASGPAGWLVATRRPAQPGAAEPPGAWQAIVYTTGAKPDDPAAAYTELEFATFGPAAAHEIEFRLLPAAPWEGRTGE